MKGLGRSGNGKQDSQGSSQPSRSMSMCHFVSAVPVSNGAATGALCVPGPTRRRGEGCQRWQMLGFSHADLPLTPTPSPQMIGALGPPPQETRRRIYGDGAPHMLESRGGQREVGREG
ncbi:hypothetical protein AAFF_G00275340 [Aldrovandia affinis]|uniref:Uncharacterized protein n=1 Tax=Aldrovandia affinis TaxID=143900 RepID=A0AAD7ST47_9TELE|nr:hypothetical protein AAFF_G00275340 [Aldrovandia affinis]